MARVLHHSATTGADRLALVALAHLADGGGVAVAQRSDLQRLAGLGESTLKAALKALVEGGEVYYLRGDGRGADSVFGVLSGLHGDARLLVEGEALSRSRTHPGERVLVVGKGPGSGPFSPVEKGATDQPLLTGKGPDPGPFSAPPLPYMDLHTTTTSEGGSSETSRASTREAGRRADPRLVTLLAERGVDRAEALLLEDPAHPGRVVAMVQRFDAERLDGKERDGGWLASAIRGNYRPLRARRAPAPSGGGAAPRPERPPSSGPSEADRQAALDVAVSRLPAELRERFETAAGVASDWTQDAELAAALRPLIAAALAERRSATAA